MRNDNIKNAAYQSGGTTSATIRWCNGASPEVLRKKHLFPKGLLKKQKNTTSTVCFVKQQVGKVLQSQIFLYFNGTSLPGSRPQSTSEFLSIPNLAHSPPVEAVIDISPDSPGSRVRPTVVQLISWRPRPCNPRADDVTRKTQRDVASLGQSLAIILPPRKRSGPTNDR